MNKCKNCGSKLKLIKHIEYDGESGSSEPYYECPNDCIYPETEDSELTREEMSERDDQNKLEGVYKQDRGVMLRELLGI